MKPLYRIFPFVVISLFACKETDDADVENKDDEPQVSLEIFDDTDPAHMWNMARYSWIRVTTDYQPSTIGVYIKLCNRYYMLAQKKSCTNDNEISFDIPIGVDKAYLAVDNLVREVSIEATAHITRSDVSAASKPAWVDKAEPLPWIVAADCDSDLDFNDFVAQVRHDADGNLHIKALAAGTTQLTWLHYVENEKEYFASLQEWDKGLAESKYVDKDNNTQYDWHTWFELDGSALPTIYAVNTLDIANGWKGKEAVIPADFFSNNYFTLSEWSFSERRYPAPRNEYAKPIYGFYITVDIEDYTQVQEGKEICKYMVCTWPNGYRPYMLVFPDVCESDTEQEHIGWSWPSEKSPIYLVYPSFNKWITDCSYNWYTFAPQGWDNYTGETNENGAFVYFGYYPRQKSQP